MEMAYRERWQVGIAELQKILSGFDLKEARKWGKLCYTLDAPKADNSRGIAAALFQGRAGAALKTAN